MSSKANKSAIIYLQRMVLACETIRTYVANTSEKEFLKLNESYDAICMQFIQLGEQVSHLEESTENIIQHFPDEIAWSALKAIRNRIGHNYTAVDAKMIWMFASDKILETEQNLNRILKKRFGV